MMPWKCPPLHLPNWNNLWKWKEQMNAKEFAHELEKAASFIRQQQAKLEHLDKMIVWYQDITMTGIKSEEYENGFWDAVGFVKQHQIGVQEK
jgi:glutaredoxin 2